MKCILHIGAEKTGSKALQIFLRDNRDALEQHGFALFLPPGDANRSAPNNRQICAMFDDPVFEDPWYQLRNIRNKDELERYNSQTEAAFQAVIESLPKHIHTVILSSEHMQSRLTSQAKLDPLKPFLDRFFSDISIVCYIREQSEVCRSSYSTRLIAGRTNSLDEIQQMCRPNVFYYSYLTMLTLWENTFGRDALIIRISSRAMMEMGRVEADFLKTIGIASDQLSGFNFASERLNQGFSPKGMSLMLKLNRTLPPSDASRLKGRLRNILISLIRKLTPPRTGRQAPSVVNEEIYQAFDAQNRELAERYLNQAGNPFAKT